MNRSRLARAHGVFNVGGALWPLVNMRRLEAVTGPKVDRWLVRTVAGLLLGNGLVQLATPNSVDGLAQARSIGIGTAAALAAIDLDYSRGAGSARSTCWMRRPRWRG